MLDLSVLQAAKDTVYGKLTEEEESRRGVKLAEELCIPADENNPEWYATKFGSKTAKGLFRTCRRIMETEVGDNHGKEETGTE